MYMVQTAWPQANLLGVDMSTYKLAISQAKLEKKPAQMQSKVNEKQLIRRCSDTPMLERDFQTVRFLGGRGGGQSCGASFGRSGVKDEATQLESAVHLRVFHKSKHVAAADRHGRLFSPRSFQQVPVLSVVAAGRHIHCTFQAFWAFSTTLANF